MYVVIGASGFLGEYVMKEIEDKTSDNIIAISREPMHFESNRRSWKKCDVANYHEVDALIQDINDVPDKKVVFLAAYHNPDLVKMNREFAWNINVTSLSYFINKLENVKCFFYPSTDSVYGNSVNGEKHKEEDLLRPVNEYGKQKCAAESIVKWYGYNVVRYPFLIGPSLCKDKKHFFDRIVESITNDLPFDLLEDSYRSAISFQTAAELLIELMEKYTDDIPKVLNLCADEALSKYEIGLIIAEKYNVSTELIVPIRMDESSSFFNESRAKSTLMDNGKMKQILDLKCVSLVV